MSEGMTQGCWMVVDYDEFKRTMDWPRPLGVCGKPARFQTQNGEWMCAEHWDEYAEWHPDEA